MIFKPNFKLNKITDISVEFLNANNIKALVLDVDNTLSTHHGMQLTDGLSEWLNLMRNNKIKLIILSNSKEARVKPFAEKLNLPYISMGLKPLPFKFLKAVSQLGVSKSNVAVVGDQLFTDSLGAHLSGIKAIILNPILFENLIGFKIKRWFEKILYKHYKF